MQFPALRDFVKMGKPVWGTCAGLIFLADKAVGMCHGSLFCQIQFSQIKESILQMLGALHKVI